MRQKLRLLSQLDLFSVPAVYREPKGLYVLEALAAGAPVVLPASRGLSGTARSHRRWATGRSRRSRGTGRRPCTSLIERRGAASPAGDATGQQAVHQRFNAQAMAQERSAVLQANSRRATQAPDSTSVRISGAVAYRQLDRQDEPGRNRTGPTITSEQSYRSCAARAAEEESRLCRSRRVPQSHSP